MAAATSLVLATGSGGLLVWKYIQSSKHVVMVLPQPHVNPPKSLANLAAGRFALARERDSTVSVITGDVHNLSDNLHRNVTVHLEILDARGEKIGEIRETIVEIPPNRIWRVIAKTSITNAVSARFQRFGEGGY